MTAPNLNNPVVDKFGLLQQAWYTYFQGLFRGTLGGPKPLIAVTVPSNANAALAGVSVGQMYTSNADPAPIYIRTA